MFLQTTKSFFHMGALLPSTRIFYIDLCLIIIMNASNNIGSSLLPVRNVNHPKITIR